MFHKFIHNLIVSSGVEEPMIAPLCTFVNASLTICVGIAFYFLTTKLIIPILSKKIEESDPKFDDILFNNKILRALSLVANVWIVLLLLPDTFAYYPTMLPVYTKISRLVMISLVTWVLLLEVKNVTDSLHDKYHGLLVLRNILNMAFLLVAILLAATTITGRDIAYVVTYLGAATAAIMFVFKDSILGMAAGIRLSVNKMFKVDDWIKVPKHNIEGFVEDITLTAVKIRNWDESISTIPPHSLIADGFVNRQEMLDKGKRLLKIKIFVDVNSVKIIPPEDLTRFEGKAWAKDLALNRPQVNLKLYRRYMLHVIRKHPFFQENPRYMVCELPVTNQGIPVGMYFFLSCTDWAKFEVLSADFHDEAIAALHLFGLRHYQLPTGHDLHRALHHSRESALPLEQTAEHAITLDHEAANAL